MELEMALKLAELDAMELVELLRELRMQDKSAFELLSEIVEDAV